MPAPYPLIEIPNGDCKDTFDQQAMEMAVIHNSFIRGLNAIIAQAPYITKDQAQPFIHFCIVYFEGIHYHHNAEETVYFPEIEKRLGLHTMDPNVDQHRAFGPQMAEFEVHIKGIRDRTIEYDGEQIVSKLNSFADVLVTHLHDEIKTLDSSGLRRVFKQEELARVNKEFVNCAFTHVTLDNTVPMFMVCFDKEMSPWFDHMPSIIVFAVKYWFSRKHAAAWKFGPCDLSMRLKKVLIARPKDTL